MSRALLSRCHQSPCPPPMPPSSPLAALPYARSSELKCTASRAPTDSETGPCRTPVSSKVSMRTAPAAEAWLTTRATPCSGTAAVGKNGTVRVFSWAFAAVARLHTPTTATVNSLCVGFGPTDGHTGAASQPVMHLGSVGSAGGDPNTLRTIAPSREPAQHLWHRGLGNLLRHMLIGRNAAVFELEQRRASGRAYNPPTNR